jgi:hypothetical protein
MYSHETDRQCEEGSLVLSEMGLQVRETEAPRDPVRDHRVSDR